MKCVSCSRDLAQVTVGGVTVDVCKSGCGGIWFDNFELTRLDEQHEAAGQELLDLAAKNPAVPVDAAKRRNCPKCANLVMMRHLYSPSDRFEVDRCPGCNGIWLDFGELAAVRSNFKTDAERRKATKMFLAQKCDPQLALLKQEHEDDRRAAKSIASVLKFLCPSYYIPGKQEWGGY